MTHVVSTANLCKKGCHAPPVRRHDESSRPAVERTLNHIVDHDMPNLCGMEGRPGAPCSIQFKSNRCGAPRFPLFTIDQDAHLSSER
jgi:hypothetical protein